MRDFHELKVWEKGHLLTLAVYAATRQFPREEIHGLTSQVRRSTSSIPTNIAEGCGRNTKADFARFPQVPMGSASETEYLLMLAKDLHYLTDEEHSPLAGDVTEIKRMLTAFMNTLRADG